MLSADVATISIRSGRRDEPSHLPRRRARRRPRAYVLLMTLVLLSLASLALVTATRFSLREAADAREAERELQRRWGSLSCRTFLLPRAEQILSEAEARREQPVTAVRHELRLGEAQFTLVFTDEQAKANVDRMLLEDDPATVERNLRSLLLDSPHAATVELPDRFAAAGFGRGPAVKEPEATRGLGGTSSSFLHSPGQLFPGLAPEELMPAGDGASDPSPLTRITCFGDGRLNVLRADPQALRSIAVPPLDYAQVERLLLVRRDSTSPDLGLAALLAMLELTDAERAVALRRLTTRSRCHGLWIRSEIGGIEQYELAVEEVVRGRGASPGPVVLQW